MTSTWNEQEVLNEVGSRRRNEWIVETNESYGEHTAVEAYACECSDSACHTLISLTRDEYESVRKDGTHFAIAVDHENPEIDRVIGQNERFAVVEKWFGQSKRISEATDPRPRTGATR